ncbi:MAG TPA: PEP-CTERM sorting domain-containing protein [Pirellulales bacterium]|nr:PEP-CTERM sorting domain-containing protein [Pirellulales bacterium]
MPAYEKPTAGGGNWVSTLNGMIASGQITLSLPQNGIYSVFDQGGYTYIATAVPEPESMMLAGMGCLVSIAAAARRKLRRS